MYIEFWNEYQESITWNLLSPTQLVPNGGRARHPLPIISLLATLFDLLRCSLMFQAIYWDPPLTLKHIADTIHSDQQTRKDLHTMNQMWKNTGYVPWNTHFNWWPLLSQIFQYWRILCSCHRYDWYTSYNMLFYLQLA